MAAAADAAVAAAQVTVVVAVVRLTIQCREKIGYGREIHWVAVQSVFRGFLTRKALRALKGLVKVQALVSGYLVRKRVGATFHSMQALVRVQAFARSQRAHLANSYKYNAMPKPSRSVCGDSIFRPYSNSPSCMATTQSFSAKLRSQSAPRHRPDLGFKKKMSVKKIMASHTSLSGVKMQRSCSQVQQNLNI